MGSASSIRIEDPVGDLVHIGADDVWPWREGVEHLAGTSHKRGHIPRMRSNQPDFANRISQPRGRHWVELTSGFQSLHGVGGVALRKRITQAGVR